MKKVRRFLVWSVLNFGLMACAIYGVYYHSEAAKNALLFITWTSTVLLTITVANKDVREKIRAKGHSVPMWMAVANDLCIMAILASAGWFLTAVAVLWQIGCEKAIYEGDDKP